MHHILLVDDSYTWTESGIKPEAMNKAMGDDVELIIAKNLVEALVALYEYKAKGLQFDLVSFDTGIEINDITFGSTKSLSGVEAYAGEYLDFIKDFGPDQRPRQVGFHTNKGNMTEEFLSELSEYDDLKDSLIFYRQELEYIHAVYNAKIPEDREEGKEENDFYFRRFCNENLGTSYVSSLEEQLYKKEELLENGAIKEGSFSGIISSSELKKIVSNTKEQADFVRNIPLNKFIDLFHAELITPEKGYSFESTWPSRSFGGPIIGEVALDQEDIQAINQRGGNPILCLETFNKEKDAHLLSSIRGLIVRNKVDDMPHLRDELLKHNLSAIIAGGEDDEPKLMDPHFFRGKDGKIKLGCNESFKMPLTSIAFDTEGDLVRLKCSFS